MINSECENLIAEWIKRKHGADAFVSRYQPTHVFVYVYQVSAEGKIFKYDIPDVSKLFGTDKVLAFLQLQYDQQMEEKK